LASCVLIIGPATLELYLD